ncbi:MAG: hypothetical protein KU37_10680 [Sulfuricurvum sp. PC08-66]|nr:MAG: hypothetical protein KU37_10680 [Sulfuricurvum sp. PC08-66]
MSTCTIDAEYKGEERYSKLSIAYQTQEDRKRIDEALEIAMKKASLTPEIYTSSLSHDRHVVVVEYQDDYDREAGAVFEELLAILDIRCI